MEARRRARRKRHNMDHAAMDEANLLMDLWRPCDVQILMRQFKQYATLQTERNLRCARTSSSGSNDSSGSGAVADGGRPLGLDLEGFCSIFSELQDIPQSVAEAAFWMFCQEGEKMMDFREFCTAITICCYGRKEKKAEIIFNLFDSDHDGFLAPNETEELVRTALKSMERLESDRTSRTSHRSTWMRQSGNDLLSELSKTEKMSREDFLAWSKKNDIITYMLELFRIVPTSEIEMRTVVSILKEHQGMTAGETWHILSARWWETWCLYTQYRAFDEAEEDGAPILDGGEGHSSSEDSEADVLNESTAVEEVVISSQGGSPSPKTSPFKTEKVMPLSTQPLPASLPSTPRAESPPRKVRPGLLRSRSMSHTSGDRPGPINNTVLEGQVADSVKPNLLEGHDYVLIPARLWQCLQSWYGGGVPDGGYPRTVIACEGAETPIHRRTRYYNPPLRTHVRLEIHPVALTFTTMDPRTGRPLRRAKEWRENFSAAVTIGRLLQDACAQYDADKTLSRLWTKPQGEEWRCLTRGPVEEWQEVSLEDADVESGDFIMVEQKADGGGEWPRDALDTYLQHFRDFEINSRVDAKDREGKWYSGTVVDLHYNADDAVEQIKVHFDRFNSKWDEWYTVDSDSLKPVYSKAEPRDKNVAPQGPLHWERSSVHDHRDEPAARRGAVGLYNLGNTCYMNSVLQCLSNTPILCDYFRSGLFEEELNLPSKPGRGAYGGYLAGDDVMTSSLGQLLIDLWCDQTTMPTRALAPKKFKKIFSQTKTQFAGYGQQDAHEFFSVLLDAVHEDLNRVVVGDEGSTSKKKKAALENGDEKKRLTSFVARSPEKTAKVTDGDCSAGAVSAEVAPTGTPPVDPATDMVSEGGTAPPGHENQLADLDGSEAWRQHLEKNRSTVVDLFHGQLRRKLRCSNCAFTQYKFEPFHCLSVALKAQFAYTVVMVPLPSLDDPCPPKTVYGVVTHQVGLVGDMKLELASLSGVQADRITIATVENNRIVAIRPDRQHLHTIREDDVLYAFERPRAYGDIPGHPPVEVGSDQFAAGPVPATSAARTEPGRGVDEYGYYYGNPGPFFTFPRWKDVFACCTSPQVAVSEDDVREEAKPDDEAFALGHGVELAYGSSEDDDDDDDRYAAISVHDRWDCRDSSGNWHNSTVVRLDHAGMRVMVRFDGFPDKWNEWIERDEFARLRPLHSVVPRPKLELVEMTLVHRMKRNDVLDAGEPKEAVTSEEESPPDSTWTERYFGTPSLIYFSSHVTNAELLGVVQEHVRNCVRVNDGSPMPYTVHINNLESTHNWRPVGDDPGRPHVRNGESIVVEWEASDAYNHAADAVTDHASVATAAGQRTSTQQSKKITLDECLQNFKAPEQLGDGYKCDKCGDVNTTSTTIDVWRLPDILVIHVKRFVYTMYVRGKLNNPMEYPVHNLDMSRVLGRALDGDELDRTLYDLYGVVHHLGTMGGGHYVATCQPPSSGNGDQEAPWFSFNDSRVHEVTDSEIVSSSGYLLFYRRQRLSAHNIINLNPPS